MPITAPTPITALPTPPSTADITNFDLRADAFNGALPGLQAQANALAANVYANALEAQGSASSAAASQIAAAISAASAAATANVTKWVTGTNYSQGACTWSPANYLTYRCKVAGVSGTDPSLDPINWLLLLPGLTPVIVSATSQAALPGNRYVLTNVAATTLTLPASPAAGDVVAVVAANGLATNIIARNGLTIMGSASDLTLDSATQPVTLQYLNSSWRLV